MKAIKSNGGSIVPERSISRIAKDGDHSNVYVLHENHNYGGVSLTFDESPDELAAMLGWNVVNEKGTDGVDARLAARLVDLTRERDEALAKLEWLTRWRKPGQPCPFPHDEIVECPDDCSLYVDDLSITDKWRPTIGHLEKYYDQYKNI